MANHIKMSIILKTGFVTQHKISTTNRFIRKIVAGHVRDVEELRTKQGQCSEIQARIITQTSITKNKSKNRVISDIYAILVVLDIGAGDYTVANRIVKLSAKHTQDGCGSGGAGRNCCGPIYVAVLGGCEVLSGGANTSPNAKEFVYLLNPRIMWYIHSFILQVLAKHQPMFLHPDFWPEGVVFHRFREAMIKKNPSITKIQTETWMHRKTRKRDQHCESNPAHGRPMVLPTFGVGFDIRNRAGKCGNALKPCSISSTTTKFDKIPAEVAMINKLFCKYIH
ncbi:hypothetical protein MSG28_000873 [Choristoneura fumiferana]|uniref:Uncharacterized protein n=1 Tax=Choristoneura fumiferana TaxID=7141 RepID=A0ACC0K2Q9_CHOFU|nr:hypothetical protein MSG28_000873 [Choristoneura fumiferana]